MPLLSTQGGVIPASLLDAIATCQTPAVATPALTADLTAASKKKGVRDEMVSPQAGSLAAVTTMVSAGLMLPSVWKMDEWPFR